MEYNFDVHWVEGKNHKIADTLSRYPVFAPNEEETNTEEEEKKIQKTIDTAIDYCRTLTSGASSMDFIIDNIDENYECLIEDIKKDKISAKTGKTMKHNSDTYASDRCYMSLKDYEGHTLVMYNATRIVIPTKARKYIANQLHAAHSGITKMMKTATQLYYLSLIHI